MVKLEINFVIEKATPGTYKFQEVDRSGQKVTAADGAKVGTLYVRKSALGSEKPEKLKVIIEA